MTAFRVASSSDEWLVEKVLKSVTGVFVALAIMLLS